MSSDLTKLIAGIQKQQFPNLLQPAAHIHLVPKGINMHEYTSKMFVYSQYVMHVFENFNFPQRTQLLGTNYSVPPDAIESHNAIQEVTAIQLVSGLTSSWIEPHKRSLLAAANQQSQQPRYLVYDTLKKICVIYIGNAQVVQTGISLLENQLQIHLASDSQNQIEFYTSFVDPIKQTYTLIGDFSAMNGVESSAPNLKSVIRSIANRLYQPTQRGAGPGVMTEGRNALQRMKNDLLQKLQQGEVSWEELNSMAPSRPRFERQ